MFIDAVLCIYVVVCTYVVVCITIKLKKSYMCCFCGGASLTVVQSNTEKIDKREVRERWKKDTSGCKRQTHEAEQKWAQREWKRGRGNLFTKFVNSQKQSDSVGKKGECKYHLVTSTNVILWLVSLSVSKVSVNITW